MSVENYFLKTYLLSVLLRGGLTSLRISYSWNIKKNVPIIPLNWTGFILKIFLVYLTSTKNIEQIIVKCCVKSSVTTLLPDHSSQCPARHAPQAITLHAWLLNWCSLLYARITPLSTGTASRWVAANHIVRPIIHSDIYHIVTPFLVSPGIHSENPIFTACPATFLLPLQSALALYGLPPPTNSTWFECLQDSDGGCSLPAFTEYCEWCYLPVTRLLQPVFLKNLCIAHCLGKLCPCSFRVTSKLYLSLFRDCFHFVTTFRYLKLVLFIIYCNILIFTLFALWITTASDLYVSWLYY